MSEQDSPRCLSRVDELMVGDQVFTPARRWETVTDLDLGAHSDWLMRVFTDRTGPKYAWSLPKYQELPTLRSWQIRDVPVVRVHDGSVHREVVAFIGIDNDPRRYDRHSYVLAAAYPMGRGRGWEVRHRPDGGVLEAIPVASKAAAVSAVKRIAKTHAAALGLRMHRSEVTR